MRLLLINWQDRLNPQAGGAEAHLHEIFGRLAARGHEVRMLVSGWPGAIAKEQVDGMEVLRAGGRHTFSYAAPAAYRRHLADQQFDLVVEALNKVPVFSPAWSSRPGLLVVHHLFGTTAFREASPPVAAATWLLERPLARFYRGIPAQVISRSTADDLVERGLRREDIRVIHPGVDLDYFAPDPLVPRAADPVFLYLGRLKRYKGVDRVVRALALLRDRGVGARLVIAGRGEQLEPLRQLTERLDLRSLVEFAGFVSEARKRELLRSCWANVFPSPKEGWGITNIEAAACGTCSIASDSPGLRESVQHEQTGLLVPHGDVEALAAAMERLARSPEEAARLGAGALAFAAGFGWDGAADATEAHLEEVVRGHAGSSA